MVTTTIPSKTITGPLDPDVHSEWIVHGPTKDKVIRVNTPGYPPVSAKTQSIIWHTIRVLLVGYIIKPTPDMGLGVFATRDIRVSNRDVCGWT